MMQGDSYVLSLEILDVDDNVVVASDVKDIEIMVGQIRKTYASGEVTFNEEFREWEVPLSQEETFKILPTANLRGQARIVCTAGSARLICADWKGYSLSTSGVSSPSV